MSPEPSLDTPPSPSLNAPSAASKGKARASTAPLPPGSPMSERTPLLSSVHTRSRSSSLSSHASAASTLTRRGTGANICAKLVLVFVVSTLLAVAGVYGLGSSYATRAARADPVAALRVRGPLHIEVLRASHEEITLRARTAAGVDAARMLGLRADEDGPAHPDPFLLFAWKALGRAGVRALGRVTIASGAARVRDPVSGVVLAQVSLGEFTLPLGVEDEGWMEDVQVDMRVEPTHDGDALIDFAKMSWTRGVIRLDVDVDDVRVRGGSRHGWRALFKVNKPRVEVGIRKKIPAIPGMPAPGRDTPLPDMSRLVTLTSFDVRTSHEKKIIVNATATMVNLAPPGLDLTVPELPYLVSLFDADNATVPMAAARSAPFSLTEHPNITLHITGDMLPLRSSAVFSDLLSDYLGGRAHPIALSTPLYPNLTFPSVFPAPDPPPRVLREVALRDMHVRLLPSGAAVGSGNVFARIVLPRGINIALDVRRVIPDVLVFDGPVPDDAAAAPSQAARPARAIGDDGDDEAPPLPPAPPLPDPLPPRAFAHIRPEDWLSATSSIVDDDGGGETGTAITLSAHFEDVPLTVLPGRQRQFRDFVGKIVFGRSALAGLQGTVAVSAHVAGLPLANGSSSGVTLDGLPFQGDVTITKPGF